MNTKKLMLKNSTMKSSMCSLKPSLTIHLKLKFPQIISSKTLKDISAIPETSHTNLQLTMLLRNLMLMLNSLQNLSRCDSNLHVLIISLLTLQLFHVKILLKGYLNFPLIFSNPDYSAE